MDKLSSAQITDVVSKANNFLKSTRNDTIARIKETSSIAQVAIDIVPQLKVATEMEISKLITGILHPRVENSDAPPVPNVPIELIEFLAYCNVHLHTNPALKKAVADFEYLFLPPTPEIEKLIVTEKKRAAEAIKRAKTPGDRSRSPSRKGTRDKSPSKREKSPTKKR